MRESIHDRARGRWRDILISVGVDSAYLSGKHTKCPICGDPGTNFRWGDKNGSGSFVCSKCTASRFESGVEFVMRFLRVPFLDAKKAIEEHIGEAKIVAPKATMDDEVRREKLRGIWTAARLLRGDDIASRYLERRNIIPDRWPDALRWVPKLTHRDEKTGVKSVYPAMLARFIAPDNTSSTLHRTWLDEPGVKAPVDPPRKAMPGPIPIGGAVRLAEPAATMGIAEGIETALAAMLTYGIPVWSALGTSGMVRWQPPKEATCILVFADLDVSYAGQHAAYTLAYRLHAEGFHVEVREPAGERPCDFNDMLMSSGRRSPARQDEIAFD